ncbi:MAG: sn-glycerol-3-phosphate ABC transporter ATP-binding protein UgpC [Phycisphaerales bacterium]
MANVSISKVAKVYDGKVRAVDDVNVEINDGEFVVLVGPSGCGKSTTLRMVAGLEAITEGTIKIGERVVNEVHPKDRDIAMVFQNYALYPHMTVRKNMAFGLTLRKMPKAEIDQRVSEAARQLGLEDLLDRKPKQLSGGQRQRVALGRAIVREPAVFLFDEPLSNLDAKLRVVTRTELKKLHQRLKTTTIYVTHDQEEAMTLGDRIVVMSAGRGTGVVEQVDTPLNVYRHPKNRFVAAFLGLPPMNIVDGKLHEENGLWFDDGQGLRVRMEDRYRDRLLSYVGGDVALGFRPSAMSEWGEGTYLPPDGVENANRITVVPRVIEPLGDSIDVSCDCGSATNVVARLAARADFPINEEVQLSLDMAHVHLFAPGDFGENLIHAPGS